MRTFKYYWLINPINIADEVDQIQDYQICSNSVVKEGNSPLAKEGEVFFGHLQSAIGLYNHSLWVFRNSEFLSQDEAKIFNEIFRTVSESYYNFGVSQPGFIIEESLVKQPPQVEQCNSTKTDTVVASDLGKIITLSEKLYSMNCNDSAVRYLFILEHIRDIRKSPAFVGELALWSFIEHYWGANKRKTHLDQSLSELLRSVYPDRRDQRALRDQISNVGVDLGKQYDEKVLRNILAHGKHITLVENWTEDNWNSFYEVHDRLLSIVLSAIESEIVSV